MKKVFLICVALIAFLATNASGGNTHQNQLHNYTVTATPQVMPVMAVNYEPTQVVVYNYTAVNLPAKQTITVFTLNKDAWRNPAEGPSLLVVSGINAKFNLSRNYRYSYTPCLLKNYKLSTINCKLFVLSARHV